MFDVFGPLASDTSSSAASALRTLTAFVAALKEHLAGTVPDWTHHEYGQGGCETCGYGADQYDVLEMESLNRQIDEFAATFAATFAAQSASAIETQPTQDASEAHRPNETTGRQS
jgi:hypothetical protein